MTEQVNATPSITETTGEHVAETVSNGGRSAGWWAMLVLIISEAALFAALIASYFYVRFHSPIWPQDNLERPDLILPVIMTVLLVLSSLFIQWGLSSIKQDRAGRMKLAMLISLLLAIGYLVLLGYSFFASHLNPQMNAYASLFFAINGLAGIYILTAILMNIFIQLRAIFGKLDGRAYGVVENVVLYWHFAIIVWLVIIVTLYLATYLT